MLGVTTALSYGRAAVPGGRELSVYGADASAVVRICAVVPDDGGGVPGRGVCVLQKGRERATKSIKSLLMVFAGGAGVRMLAMLVHNLIDFAIFERGYGERFGWCWRFGRDGYIMSPLKSSDISKPPKRRSWC
jgi:hypothetical protein